MVESLQWRLVSKALSAPEEFALHNELVADSLRCNSWYPDWVTQSAIRVAMAKEFPYTLLKKFW